MIRVPSEGAGRFPEAWRHCAGTGHVDQVVDAYLALGIRFCLELDFMPGELASGDQTVWPIEVWNEPNLPDFWQGADETAYHRLYEVTAGAVSAARRGRVTVPTASRQGRATAPQATRRCPR